MDKPPYPNPLCSYCERLAIARALHDRYHLSCDAHLSELGRLPLLLTLRDGQTHDPVPADVKRLDRSKSS